MSFITIEGGEGTGKSTLIQGLAETLRTDGSDVVVTREPGGTPGAEQIRDLLVKGDVNRWSPTTELLLLNAARRDHVERVIRPALENGSIVLCDRYVDSTTVYQGMRGVEIDLIRSLHESVIGVWPDRTLILDVPPEVGLQRAAARGGDDRFESMGAKFHDDVREAFQQITVANSHRCVSIDATRPPEMVLADALNVLRA